MNLLSISFYTNVLNSDYYKCCVLLLSGIYVIAQYRSQ